MRFEYTDGSGHDFIALCRELDEFLNECAGGEENRAEYIPYNRLDDIHDVVLAYDGDIPVGCAAFKKYDDECAEVKRVFVKQEYRGRGISKKLMELLEDAARKQGYRHLILESGEALATAMVLYRKIGYTVIPNYGQYEDMPDSVCMKKNLYIPVCERRFEKADCIYSRKRRKPSGSRKKPPVFFHLPPTLFSSLLFLTRVFSCGRAWSLLKLNF